MDRLALVVPCYNEEAVLEISAKELKSVLSDLIQKQKISSDSFILFVNDGSKDRTWELIEKEHREREMVFGLKLAGNVGHQFALTAGLLTAKDICDIAVFDAAIPCKRIVRSVSPDSYACLDPLRLEEACIEDGHREGKEQVCHELSKHFFELANIQMPRYIGALGINRFWVPTFGAFFFHNLSCLVFQTSRHRVTLKAE